MLTSAALRGILMLGTGALAVPAVAQTAPPAAVTVSGQATVTSDDRYRGLSLSDRDPAIQGGLTISHRSGFYAGVWASSIAAYVAGGADAEVDLYAGYRQSFGGTTIDAGLLYDSHPGGAGAVGDFVEPYLGVSHSLGPVSAKVGVDAAWAQSGLAIGGQRRGGTYGYGELSSGIPTTPLTLTAHVGRSFTANYATFGRRYTDWSLTGAYVWHALTLSLAYVDTDATIGTALTRGGRDRRIGGGGVLGSLSVAF